METVDVIYKLIKETHITAAQLTRESGLTNGLLSQWKKGLQEPSLKNLQKIADFFNVSINYLLTGEEPQTKNPPASKAEDDIYPDDFSFALSGEVKELTDDQRKSVIAFVKLLKQQDDMEGK
jgi:transcriptional regulator with XRE-family HTH domain